MPSLSAPPHAATDPSPTSRWVVSALIVAAAAFGISLFAAPAQASDGSTETSSMVIERDPATGETTTTVNPSSAEGTSTASSFQAEGGSTEASSMVIERDPATGATTTTVNETSTTGAAPPAEGETSVQAAVVERADAAASTGAAPTSPAPAAPVADEVAAAPLAAASASSGSAITGGTARDPGGPSSPAPAEPTVLSATATARLALLLADASPRTSPLPSRESAELAPLLAVDGEAAVATINHLTATVPAAAAAESTGLTSSALLVALIALAGAALGSRQTPVSVVRRVHLGRAPVTA